MNKIENIRGTYDLLPNKSPLWEVVEDKILSIVSSYGYGQIRMPIIEETALFIRSIGEVTDIVEKEMYTFKDRDKYSLTLRPEGTASCVRACIQHNLFYGETPRLWYMGPMFRHERPQKERYRQFYQLGCEAFGMSDPNIDAELIAMSAKLWQELGIAQHVRLELNSLGQAAERELYKKELIAYFKANIDQLDEDSLRRLERNPLRILDSKNADMSDLIAKAPRLLDHIDPESAEHFEGLCERLKQLGVEYTINPSLVRGLDYYNRTVFEWVTDHLGAQGTICAGGRYDGLVKQLGGDDVPACGFAMGLERIITLVEELSTTKGEAKEDIYLVKSGDVDAYAWQVAERLRSEGLRVLMHFSGGNFKKQMKKADKSSAKLAVIIGEAEAQAQTVSIKYLREQKSQETLAFAELSKLSEQAIN